MTKVNHELSIAELDMVSGGGLASGLAAHEAAHKAAGGSTGTGTGSSTPGWWNPPGGYLNMGSIRALGPIQF